MGEGTRRGGVRGARLVRCEDESEREGVRVREQREKERERWE